MDRDTLTKKIGASEMAEIVDFMAQRKQAKQFWLHTMLLTKFPSLSPDTADSIIRTFGEKGLELASTLFEDDKAYVDYFVEQLNTKLAFIDKAEISLEDKRKALQVMADNEDSLRVCLYSMSRNKNIRTVRSADVDSQIESVMQSILAEARSPAV
jgi:hypothetical protein